jgi:hypothetical protein
MPPKKQKVLELDDEPRVKQEPGVEQQQQQQVGGDVVVETLVVSNSRLCAQVDACDARAFTEWERARVLEEQLTESKAHNSILEAEGRAKDAEATRLQLQMARDSSVKEAEHKARVAILEADMSRLRDKIASMQQQQQLLFDLVARLAAQPAAARVAGGAAAPAPAPAPLLLQQQQAHITLPLPSNTLHSPNPPPSGAGVC